MYRRDFDAEAPTTTPVCPWFRLRSDPEARALSFGQDRVCRAGGQSQPIAMDWQAHYCLDGFRECPLYVASRRAGHQRAAEQLIHALDAGHGAPPSAGGGRRPVRQAPPGVASPALTPHAPFWVRRPAMAAIATVLAIGGFWAGIALASGGPGSIVRPSDQSAQERVQTRPTQAYTLTTERPTPVPTPPPPPVIQPPAATSLSLGSAVRAPDPPASPVPSVATPTATPIPEPVTPAAAPAQPEPALVPASPQPAPASPVPAPVVSSEPTPEPSPPVTATPQPEPTVSPVPVATPTPTPVPTPTPTPSPTPDPWDALPPVARTGQPVSPESVATLTSGMEQVAASGSQMLGAYRIGIQGPYAALPYHAAVLFGQGSGFEHGALNVAVGQPVRRAVIVVEGTTDPSAVASILRFSVNGLTLWEGLSPFPRGSWGSVAWVVDDPSLLIGSAIRVMLSNTTPGAAEDVPWVAISSVTVYFE